MERQEFLSRAAGGGTVSLLRHCRGEDFSEALLSSFVLMEERFLFFFYTGTTSAGMRWSPIAGGFRMWLDIVLDVLIQAPFPMKVWI